MRTDKYIVTQTKANEDSMEYLAHLPGKDVRERVLYLDDEVIDGAFYVATSWFWKATPPGPQAHAHEFPEVLAFFGTSTPAASSTPISWARTSFTSFCNSRTGAWIT